MANSYLLLALLLLIPLFAIANRHGIELHQGNPRGLEDIDRILRSANRNLVRINSCPLFNVLLMFQLEKSKKGKEKS